MSSENKKARLRRDMLAKRATFFNTAECAETAAQFAYDFVSELQPKTVALYYPFGSELSTLPLAKKLWAAEKVVVLPVVHAENASMIFKKWNQYDKLNKGLCGNFEPIYEDKTDTPDIIFTPLLAYDAQGFRLGMGGGYYDRTFADLSKTHPKIRFIGYAFAEQKISHVPHEAFDVRLHGVVTEAGYLECKS